MFNGGAPVGSTTVQDDGSVIALLSVIGPGDPSLIGAEFEVVTNSPSTILATLRFENLVNVQAVGGPSFGSTLAALRCSMNEPAHEQRTPRPKMMDAFA